LKASIFSNLFSSQEVGMNRARNDFHPAVYIGMAAYMLVTFLLLGLGDKVIAATIPEDHYFENMGALALFIASLFFFYCFGKSFNPQARARISWLKRLVYLGLALLFFFGAAEEISWGQRILNIATPAELANVNTQEELNLHNLPFLQRGHLLTIDRLFDMFWFLFAVAVPVAVLAFPRLRGLARKLVPVVPWGLGALFLLDYVLAKLAKLLLADRYTYARITLQQAVQEVKESNYAILFILAGVYAVWELNRTLRQNDEPQERPKPA
jgi:hypothetical protein